MCFKIFLWKIVSYPSLLVMTNIDIVLCVRKRSGNLNPEGPGSQWFLCHIGSCLNNCISIQGDAYLSFLHFCARALIHRLSESYMTQVCEVAHMRPHMYPICPQEMLASKGLFTKWCQVHLIGSAWRCLLAMNHQDPSGNASFGRKRWSMEIWLRKWRNSGTVGTVYICIS